MVWMRPPAAWFSMCSHPLICGSFHCSVHQIDWLWNLLLPIVGHVGTKTFGHSNFHKHQNISKKSFLISWTLFVAHLHESLIYFQKYEMKLPESMFDWNPHLLMLWPWSRIPKPNHFSQMPALTVHEIFMHKIVLSKDLVTSFV